MEKRAFSLRWSSQRRHCVFGPGDGGNVDSVRLQWVQLCSDGVCPASTAAHAAAGTAVCVAHAPYQCTLPHPTAPSYPQEQGKPHLHPNILMDFMNNKMNKTELVQGAIFDLLFSQCDRHQQNIFLEETGKVWLIDNDQVGGGARKIKGTQQQ